MPKLIFLFWQFLLCANSFFCFRHLNSLGRSCDRTNVDKEKSICENINDHTQSSSHPFRLLFLVTLCVCVCKLGSSWYKLIHLFRFEAIFNIFTYIRCYSVMWSFKIFFGIFTVKLSISGYMNIFLPGEFEIEPNGWKYARTHQIWITRWCILFLDSVLRTRGKLLYDRTL